jgi:hypothetical protein
MNNGFLAAALIAALGGLGVGRPEHPISRILSTPRIRRPHPTMAVSSPEVIAEHNRNVRTRQVLRRQSRPWKISARWDA